MPGLQVVNFGSDPYANAMGEFARSFADTFATKHAQRRNDELFSKISSKYGKDANPDDVMRDLLQAEGFDQEYKRNKINEIKEYASLIAKGKLTPYEQAMLDFKKEELEIKKKKKSDEEKPITPYQRKLLKNQEVRLAQDKQRLEQAAKNEDKKLPEYIDKYTTNLLKDSDTKLPPYDKAELNDFVQQLMTDKENPMSVNEAFNHAFQYIEGRRERIETFKPTPRPTSWIGDANPQEVAQALDKLYQEIKFLHDEDGIENQKDLREIATRGGWKPEEITKVLQKVFQEAGKKLKGPQGSNQGKAAQVAGVDDILFGE